MPRFAGDVLTIPTLAERAQDIKARTHFLRRSSAQVECCAISRRALFGAMLVSAGLWALIILGARQFWLLFR